MSRHKLENIILAFANHRSVKNLGLTKLYKLVYFADVRHLREFGQTITGIEYIKLPNGPVPCDLDTTVLKLSDKGALKYEMISLARERYMRKISDATAPNMRCFTNDEIESIEWSAKLYGAKSAEQLSEISHAEPAWHYAELKGKLSIDLMMYGSADESDDT